MKTVEPGIKEIPPTKTKPGGHMVVVEAINPEGERKVFKQRFRGDKSLRNARQYQAELKEKIESGELWRELEIQEATIGRYVLTKYLPRILARNSPGDAQQKKSASKVYLPRFGNTRLVDLRPHDIEQWVYELEKKKSKNKKRYSKATIAKYLQCFRTVVMEACRYYNLPNPFDRLNLTPRQIKGRPKKRKVATQKELQALHRGLLERIAEAKDEKRYKRFLPMRALMLRLFKVQFLTGCRTSEVLYLQKEHVHRDELALTIEGAVVDREPGPTKKGKLANDKRAGIRKIPVPQPVIDAIDEWLEIRGDHGFPDTDTIFTNEEGKYLTDDIVRSQYKSACEKANSHPVTPHMLRHTLNDMLRRRGAETLARQALLGHSDEAMNINYTHARAEETRPHLDNVINLFNEISHPEGPTQKSDPTQNPTQSKSASENKN